MQIFAPGFVERPFWWDAAPPTTPAGPVPEAADVVVIGGGIAGLSTALELARNGVKPVVLDREAIGWGASSRNGGALSGAGALGRSKANMESGTDAKLLAEMVEEAEASFEAFEALVAREEIDCFYRRTGRFVGAHAPSAMAALEKRAEMLNKADPGTAFILPKNRVAEEVATERYYGGLRFERAGSVHPGLYTQGLAKAAARAGAILCGGVTVEGWQKAGSDFLVMTSAGEIRAKSVMVATNGYTGGATPWHRRRLVPVASFMIATEEIGKERVKAQLPHLRVYGDTKKVLYYFRPSPDGQRILFGGRASFTNVDVRQSSARLHAFLTHLLPGLEGVRITHGWKGNVAFAIDMMPHVGVQDGVHYALACNGSGVVTMTHLGRAAAGQILGGTNRPSAFSRTPFPTMPFYDGRPWFMPIVGAAYRFKDWRSGWRAPR